MTTWQDEQPKSRRALRENERKHAQAVLSEDHEVEVEEQAADQQIWRTPVAPEPLNYATRGRAQDPQPQPDSRRARPAQPVQNAGESAPFRLRDFSPESRGSAFTPTGPSSAMPWTPPSSGGGDLNYHTADGADRGVQKPLSETPPKLGTPHQSAAVHQDAVDGIPTDMTLTRRELRALREAAAARGRNESPAANPVSSPAAAAPAPVVPLPAEPAAQESPKDQGAASFDLVQPDVSQSLPPVAPRSEKTTELTSALAEFDALYRGRISNSTTAEKAEETEALRRDEAESASRDASGATAAADVAEAPAAVKMPSEPTSVATPTTPAAPTEIQPPRIAPSYAAAPPVERPRVQPAPAPAQVEPSATKSHLDAADPAAQDREIVIAPEMSNRPHGHWSTQADIDDKDQTADHALSRNLAAIDAITTNALVLPNFSTTAPLTGPVSNTGEILVTGSIDLPRSLGMSGLHPARYDRADVDQLDRIDREDAAPDSAPVRATRAVSTHTSSQGIIATRRPKSNNLPVILSITAGVMMVGVVVLVVAGMVFKIF